jgi:hypothetical protein
VVDLLIPTKMMRSILILLLLAIGQPLLIPMNVLSIHEISILLVTLSKAFITSIQDLVHSLNNNYFQAYVQILKPYGKLVI